MPRSILVLAVLLAAAVVPAAAEARSEFAVFTVELSGSYSASWSSPGVPGPGAPSPEQARGSIVERGSFRTREPIPINVQGLWGRDLQFFVLRGRNATGGIPVDAELTRTGSIERVRFKDFQDLTKDQWKTCNTDQQKAADPSCWTVETPDLSSCFGERRWTGEAGLSLAPMSVSAPGTHVDSEIFDCDAIDSALEPGSLTPGSWESIAAKLKNGPARFKSAKPGSKWTVTARSAKPCRQPAPATCTPGVLEATATFRFVCRSPTSFKGCLTPQLRRKHKIGR